MNFRREKDFLGEMDVKGDAYYGIQTLRAVQNFPITGIPIHRELIIALADVKKAAARANMDVKMMKPTMGQAIVMAADEIIAGELLSEFIVDSIQGGAGTSINMNMNEVLANRALELMGKHKGDYFQCNPNIHVNMSQSTNDTIPTALKIAAYRSTQKLMMTLKKLVSGLKVKADEFDDVLKIGRTHLQDAVPIRMGQEFSAYASVLQRDVDRLHTACELLTIINMGATAVGTGLNAKQAYIDKVAIYLSEQIGIELKTADNLVDATQNTDVYAQLSAALKVCATNLSKMSNDIRMMASGPFTGFSEIKLPTRQPGSSIMPGKVNPVMAEVMNQVSFQVIGNDHTISMACEAGQFELNVMAPVIVFNLLQSLDILNNGVHVFYEYMIKDMEANREQCKSYVENSFGIITALNPHLGYDTAAQIVKEALHSGKTVKEIILERSYLTEEEMNEILNPLEMTTPGIAGEVFLYNQ
ncbi:aspartate ammonia-lyase [Longirhabdus pacifica]|uniref:aspartate ammonia-lyase n=1 Tax=Longirhabdus pacifica TaxID=2305227 RepID=UPI001008C89D|nr:aspartate ammonia-lyase [Longirhabdus pacifica]